MNPEIILAIDEVRFDTDDDRDVDDVCRNLNSQWGLEYGKWAGFFVRTNRRVLRFLISDSDQCCETWGHLSSEDDLQSFVGADLRSIEGTTKALRTKSFQELVKTPSADLVFLNLNTSRGTLQFCAYTDHNGYYGHDVVVDDGSKVYDVTATEDLPPFLQGSMRERTDDYPDPSEDDD